VKPTIAIVGASTRAAAASAIRAGYQPVTADIFADVDLRAIATTTRISPYPEGFLDWLRLIEPPAWMYTGALENHPALVDQMAWIAPLWGNPGDVLERVRSPWELADALRSAGLLFPETRRTADGLPHDGSWLAKSYHGASGSGVRALSIPFPSREVPGEGSAGPAEFAHPLVYQRRIPGTPAAAVFVAADGIATLLGVTQQIIGEDWLRSHGFQYSGSIGPLPISSTTRATIEQIGNTLASEFELVGLFGVDMIINDEGVWTIEVNPRYTASVEIVERITGTQALALHIAACIPQRAGASPPPSKNSAHASENIPTHTHAKAILFAKQDITLTPQFVDFALAESQQSPWPTLADISPANDLIEAGRPILTLFAEGASISEVETRLRQRVAELEQRIYGG